MAFSRCGVTNKLYMGVRFSFIRQVNDTFIPLNLLVEIRVSTKGVNYAKDLDLIAIGDN